MYQFAINYKGLDFLSGDSEVSSPCDCMIEARQRHGDGLTCSVGCALLCNSVLGLAYQINVSKSAVFMSTGHSEKMLLRHTGCSGKCGIVYTLDLVVKDKI
jgi:hypothetical protein